MDKSTDIIGTLEWILPELEYLTVTLPNHTHMCTYLHNWEDTSWTVCVDINGSDAGAMIHQFTIFASNTGFTVNYNKTHVNFYDDAGFRWCDSITKIYLKAGKYYDQWIQLLMKIEDKFGVPILDKINLP